MATYSIKVTPNYRGEWSETESYTFLDAVYYNSVIYIIGDVNGSSTVGTIPSVDSAWTVMLDPTPIDFMDKLSEEIEAAIAPVQTSVDANTTTLASLVTKVDTNTDSLTTISDTLTNQGRLITGLVPKDWAGLDLLVNTGYAASVIDIGDTFDDTWTDTAASTSYDFPWRANHFETCDIMDDESIVSHNGLWLQSKWATPFDVQFTAQQAFYYAETELAAGTYYFTFGSDYHGASTAYINSGDSWSFTLTQVVPAGGKIAPHQSNWRDAATSSWTVDTYAADGITKIEENLVVTSGATGTALGTLPLHTDYTSNLGGIQGLSYGSNCWAKSAYRQWLNSAETKGNWWTPQTKFDIAPTQLSTKDGFLCGVSEELLNVMKYVKTRTYRNNVDTWEDGQTYDDCYDRVNLISYDQMYINNAQVTSESEGEPHEYWKEVNGTTTKWALWQTYPALIHYGANATTTAVDVWARSAYRTSSSNEFGISSSGSVGHYGAINARRSAPLIFI